MHTLDKAVKGTVVNQTLPSLHIGSLEMELTVPLICVLPLFLLLPTVIRGTQ